MELDHHVTEISARKSMEYWSEIPATIEGMLGGYGKISNTDLESSKKFLDNLLTLRKPPDKTQALDVGAGIGRVTKNLLCQYFEKVDLLEQNPRFLHHAKLYLGPILRKKIGNYYVSSLQDFEPELGKYDVIWVQWVVGYLDNVNLINFLMRCKKGLRKNGVIVIKDNVTFSSNIIDHNTDPSITRPLKMMKSIFYQAGLAPFKETKEKRFPKELLPVLTFALRPIIRSIDDSSGDRVVSFM